MPFANPSSTRRRKRFEAMEVLGKPPVVINSDNREHARKWLNGIGFRSNQYVTLANSMLEQLYRGADGIATQALEQFARDHNAQPHRIEQMVKWLKIDAQAKGWNGEKDNHEKDNHEKDNHEKKVPEEWSPEGNGQSEQQSQEVEQMEVPPVDTSDLDDPAAMLAKALAAMQSQNSKPGIDREEVRKIIKEEMNPSTHVLEIMIKKQDGEEKKLDGLAHYCVPKILKAMNAQTSAGPINVLLVGPAGSGKTTAAKQVAEALGLPFYFNGAIASEYKLSGFIDAQGRVISTAFKKAYTEGGLYLFDEIDGSMPQAVMAFNAALAGDSCDFPDGNYPKHPDFRCIAAANTYGRGADRQYVGRYQQDAATLDRFIPIAFDYDEALEIKISPNEDWTRYVQRVRRSVERLKIRHIVSPRTSIAGGQLVEAGGFNLDEIKAMTLWKGLDKDSIKKIEADL